MRNIKWRRVLLALVIVLILASAGFVLWANAAMPPMDQAVAALQSDSVVRVTNENGWYVFHPVTQTPSTGLVFYPGAKVDPRAYAPQMRDIAAAGYLAVVPPMPLNLAIFGINKAGDVIQTFPDIQRWAVGGHSLGGVMAAHFAQANPSLVQGLVFWASYPDIDLSKTSLAVTSIYGTVDGMAKPDTVKNSASMLPSDAVFVPIIGGNHGQFGWYGPQPGDNPAAISHADQQSQTVKATIDLLSRISGHG